MNRKKFLKQALMGATGAALGKSAIVNKHQQNDEDNLLLSQVGFNHLPKKEIKTMKTVLHKANSRGHADHGWLDTHHTFSFATYMNRDRMNFGVLRVLNDDVVAGGRGFGTHPHDNMEIVSIPLEGDLEHKDSMGNTTVIRQGDIQVMSAGTGVYHSEYNKNADQPVKFLQIWMFPNQQAVKPRYDQITLKAEDLKNQLHQILSPNPDDAGVWVHQDAWFHRGQFDPGFEQTYTIKKEGNGVYLFVINGTVLVEGQRLENRDGLGVWDTEEIKMVVENEADILLMEVPMKVV